MFPLSYTSGLPIKPLFVALQTSNKGLIVTKRTMSYEQGGKIQCHMSNSTLRPHRSTVRCPSFSFCIKSLTMQSYKPCSNFLVYALGGYAGVWASWNWQVHTKKKGKKEIDITAHAKRLSTGVSFICACICHCT